MVVTAVVFAKYLTLLIMSGCICWAKVITPKHKGTFQTGQIQLLHDMTNPSRLLSNQY